MFRCLIILLVLVISSFSISNASNIFNNILKKNEQTDTQTRSKDIIKNKTKIKNATRKVEIKEKEIELIERRLNSKKKKLDKLNSLNTKGEKE